MSYLVGWVEVRNPTSLGRAQPNLRNLLVAEVRTNPSNFNFKTEERPLSLLPSVK